MLTDEQLKHMVDRFLMWRLPENFNPDAGISFKKTFNDHLPVPMKHEPVGTNLFDAEQAKDMILHMLEGMPGMSAEQFNYMQPALGFKIATQPWTWSISVMQQSVLISAIRGCDGMPKKHKIKPLLRWYRRCVLMSAFDMKALTDPFEEGGGSFTGPLADVYSLQVQGTDGQPEYIHPVTLLRVNEHDARCGFLQQACDWYIDSRDELPSHFQDHFMHAVEIVGYKHPDTTIREFWHDLYVRLVHAKHVWPETEEQLDKRLGDNFDGWAARSDESTSCSD